MIHDQKPTDYLMMAIVSLMGLAIPAGLVLWYLHPNSAWWVLSVGAFIVFMAG